MTRIRFWPGAAFAAAIGVAAPAGAQTIDDIIAIYGPDIGAVAQRLSAECRADGGEPTIVPDFVVSSGEIEPGRDYEVVIAGGVHCYPPRSGDDYVAEVVAFTARYCDGPHLCTAWLFVEDGARKRIAWTGRVVNIMGLEEMGQFALQLVYPCQGATCDVRHRWNGRTLVPAARRRR